MDQQPVSQPDTPPSQPVQKASGKLPWILLAIVALALGGVVALLFTQLQSANTQLATANNELASAEGQVKNLASSTNDSSDTTNQDSSVSSDDDQSQIIATTIGWGTARKGSETTKLNVTIIKKQLPFASVSVGVEGDSGYGCTLKKSNDIWLVLFCGQSGPPQSTLDEWGIPASFAKSDY
ncbi:MAG: hypothetical protein WBP12_03385 [Candidatus Saccharimonas sp.]